MTILFVNACMRGSVSRTLCLCRDYLAGKSDVVEANLASLDLHPFTGEMVEERSYKNSKKYYEDPIFALAKQFAAADEIVIGAPYWDLSFPSALKVYIEHVSVDGITFRFTEDGEYIGLCNASRIIYITTRGGFESNDQFGYEYICGVAGMFGIPEVRLVSAEGMDAAGFDTERQLAKARKQLRLLSEEDI